MKTQRRISATSAIRPNNGLPWLLLLCLAAAYSGPLYAAKTVEFDKIGFYEAGEDGSDDAPEEWDDGRIRNRFAQGNTRYVFTMISLKNLRWNLGDQEVTIHLRYYRSDGSLFGDPVIEYTVPGDWEFAELWNGWGWPDPGKWKRDRYRVELWQDNRRKIGESHFTIY